MAKERCKMLDLNITKKLLDSVDVILCDCDGVMWTTDSVIPGGPNAINKLKSMGKKVLYVTNNSNKSRKEYVQKFLKLGYHVVDDEIFSSSFVTADYLRNYKYHGKVNSRPAALFGRKQSVCRYSAPKQSCVVSTNVVLSLYHSLF